MGRLLELRARSRPAQLAVERNHGSLDIVPADTLPRDLSWRDSPWLGGVAALALHALAVAGLGLGLWATEPGGGGGQHLEAISIDLVSSDVLEATNQKPAMSKGGATADLAASEGAPQSPQHSLQTQNDKGDETPAQTEQPAKENAPVTKHKPPQSEAAAIPVGGATARAMTESSQAPAAAGASAGEINRYAVAVRAVLARSKPRGMREKGSLTVTFGIDETGGVHFARVSESSGRSTLDEATIAAVRGSSFPRPPTGMTADQRTYVVPFRFK